MPLTTPTVAAPSVLAPPIPAPPVPMPPAPPSAGRHRRVRAWGQWWRRMVGRAQASADAGMATAEYAIVTVAAVAFAGLLIVVLRSDEVRGLLMGIIRGALSV